MSAPEVKGEARQQYKKLWKEAKGLYPKGSKRPPLRFEKPEAYPGPERHQAYQPSGTPDVVMTRGGAKNLANKRSVRGKQLALHEWAHSFQRPSLVGKHLRTEGGAEAFSQYAARKLGIGRLGGGSYSDEVKKVKRRKPKSWIRHGQFKGGPDYKVLDHPAKKGTKQPKGDDKLNPRQTKILKALAKAKGKATPLNRAFGPDETITFKQAAALAESVGLPGITYAQIAQGESGLRPGVPNPDDAYKSLWQMTPSVQSPETVAKWDAIAAKHPGGSTNPIVAAKQAKVLAGDTTGVSNYYGTGFMTDEDAHLPGGKAQAQRILGGGSSKKVSRLIRKAKKAGIEKPLKELPGPRPLKKKPGKWAGSLDVAKEVGGPLLKQYQHSGKRTPEENTAVGGATASDHLTTSTNSWANDFFTTSGEPVAQKLAKRAGIKGYTSGNYDRYTSKKYPGYSFQLLWNVQGHLDHVHMGVRWEGERAPAGTVSGGSSTGGIGTIPGGTGAASTLAAATGTTTAQASKAIKKNPEKAMDVLRKLGWTFSDGKLSAPSSSSEKSSTPTRESLKRSKSPVV